jgi:hypothetical protein
MHPDPLARVSIDEQSLVAEQVSAPEGGPSGWMQQVNFLVFGVPTIVYAIGLHPAIGLLSTSPPACRST